MSLSTFLQIRKQRLQNVKYFSKGLVQIISCEDKIRTQVSLPPKPKLSIRSVEDESKVSSQAQRIALAKVERQEIVEEYPGKWVGKLAEAQGTCKGAAVGKSGLRWRGKSGESSMRNLTDWRGTGGQGSFKQGHPQNWVLGQLWSRIRRRLY